MKRCMKSDVSDVNSRCQRHAEGLHGAIQVLVIQRVLVMPNSSTWVGYLVTHEPDAIVARIRLDLVYCRSCPRLDGRLHSHGAANCRKRERRTDAGYAILTVGRIIVHVALSRVTLAPGVFVRRNVLRFSEVSRAWVE